MKNSNNKFCKATLSKGKPHRHLQNYFLKIVTIAFGLFDFLELKVSGIIPEPKRYSQLSASKQASIRKEAKTVTLNIIISLLSLDNYFDHF